MSCKSNDRSGVASNLQYTPDSLNELRPKETRKRLEGKKFSLHHLQQHPRYKEIQDKQLVAFLTKQISTMNRQIEQNNINMTKWQGEVKSDIYSMLQHVPDDCVTYSRRPTLVPHVQSYFFSDHEHTRFASGCQKCFTVLSKYIRDKSQCILSKVEKMPIPKI